MTNIIKTLEKADAWGAIEDPKLTETGHQWFQEFTRNGRFKCVETSMEMIPWLNHARFYSKLWNATWAIHPPYQDHYRYFVDQDTRERIVTIQPYFLEINNDTKLPKEFYEICNKCEPDPQEELYKQIVAQITDKARSGSEAFAARHGLTVNISNKSWYNPGKTILIEYKLAA